MKRIASASSCRYDDGVWYFLQLLMLTCGFFTLGLVLSRRRNRSASLHSTLAAICLLIGTAVWLGSAWWARFLVDGMGPGWRVAEAYALQGKWYVFAGGAFFALGIATCQPGLTRLRKTALVSLNLLVILALTWRTMPVYSWLSRSLERDEQGHIRQSIEFTCGPVALGNLQESWGHPAPHERDLARLAGTTYEGTTVGGLIRAAEANGFQVKVCAPMTVAELQALDDPVIIQISTLPGLLHATLLTHFSEQGAHSIDPAYGEQVIPRSRLKKILTGTALVLVPADQTT